MTGKDGVRRYSMFFAGVPICAAGIALITRAGLGTSPISSIPFVLSLITPPTMGVYTLVFNMLFLACEALLLRRFTALQALQIPATLVFSACIDLALDLIPTQYGGPYPMSLLYLADVIMLPGEAFVRALSRALGREFGNVKVCFDSSLTLAAALIALLAFHKLNGVREGTLVSALAVGQLVRFYTRRLGGLRVLWLGPDGTKRSEIAE